MSSVTAIAIPVSIQMNCSDSHHESGDRDPESNYLMPPLSPSKPVAGGGAKHSPLSECYIREWIELILRATLTASQYEQLRQKLN